MRTGRSMANMEDIVGPILLCVLLVTALGVNFYLRAPVIFSSEDVIEAASIAPLT